MLLLSLPSIKKEDLRVGTEQTMARGLYPARSIRLWKTPSAVNLDGLDYFSRCSPFEGQACCPGLPFSVTDRSFTVRRTLVL